jgi:hypothetical protein
MADILSVRQQREEAAKALSLTSFREPSGNGDGSFIAIWLCGFNEALSYLHKTGLAKTLSLIDDELLRASEDRLAFEQIMRFFLDNPRARMATPTNFPDGSPARTVLYEFMREMGDNPPKGLEVTVAAVEFSNCQRTLERLMAAKDALQRAIASEH